MANWVFDQIGRVFQSILEWHVLNSTRSVQKLSWWSFPGQSNPILPRNVWSLYLVLVCRIVLVYHESSSMSGSTNTSASTSVAVGLAQATAVQYRLCPVCNQWCHTGSGPGRRNQCSALQDKVDQSDTT